MFNPFPEEIDRQIVSFFADSHFCPNSWAVANLKHAHGKKVNTQQNTLYESLKLAQSNAVPASESQKFFILVMHRQENLFNAEFIDYVIKTITEVSATMKCLFVMHPLTKATLSKLGLLETVQNNANIQVVSNVPYVEFMQILARAEFLLTDGGSNQEEAYYLGKPCLILRKATERIEGLHENVVLYNGNGDFIKDFVADYQKYNRPKLEVAVEPSKIILSELEAL
jgi:UDP-N-acetylglucosamine 2-epimerase (non-hydrolysing)